MELKGLVEKILIGSIVAGFFSAANADCPCNDPLEKFVSNVMTPTKEVMTQNIKEFCHDNAIKDQYITTNHDFESWSQESPEDRAKFMFAYPWLSSLIPDEKYRRANFDFLYDVKAMGLSSFREVKAALSGSNFSSKLPGKLTLQQLESSKQFTEINNSVSSWQRLGLCGKLTLFHARNCSKGLKEIVDTISPKVESSQNQSFADVSLYKEVFSDPRYVLGAKKAALKVVERVESGKITSNDNLFDDLSQSYREAGLSSEDADNFTWNILALMSTAGPNIVNRINLLKVAPEFDSLKLALTMITQGASVLDSRSTGTGHIYSYPKAVLSTCDSGKPYHFWLTAYLARKLTLESGDPVGASAAAFLAQKGYEMKSNQIQQGETQQGRLQLRPMILLIT